jgi:CheY-like chemotaxis protein
MNKHILVVDDQPAIVEVIQEILQGAGYRVETSPNGASLQHMGDDLPDLILLDILLSGEDGRTLCQRLKEHEQTQHIPLILMSAHLVGQDDIEACQADAFLVKPFRVRTLLDLVSSWTAQDERKSGIGSPASLS